MGLEFVLLHEHPIVFNAPLYQSALTAPFTDDELPSAQRRRNAYETHRTVIVLTRGHGALPAVDQGEFHVAPGSAYDQISQFLAAIIGSQLFHGTRVGRNLQLFALPFTLDVQSLCREL